MRPAGSTHQTSWRHHSIQEELLMGWLGEHHLSLPPLPLLLVPDPLIHPNSDGDWTATTTIITTGGYSRYTCNNRSCPSDSASSGAMTYTAAGLQTVVRRTYLGVTQEVEHTLLQWQSLEKSAAWLRVSFRRAFTAVRKICRGCIEIPVALHDMLICRRLINIRRIGKRIGRSVVCRWISHTIWISGIGRR
jgi:hypothetical protein